MKTTLLAAAVSGILLGAAGLAHSQEPVSVEGGGGGGSLPLAETTKHACKGQNECKGQGGCKTTDPPRPAADAGAKK